MLFTVASKTGELSLASPRIVKLVGSVIDYSYHDHTPVLLVMERLTRDLYTALRHKLLFRIR